MFELKPMNRLTTSGGKAEDNILGCHQVSYRLDAYTGVEWQENLNRLRTFSGKKGGVEPEE